MSDLNPNEEQYINVLRDVYLNGEESDDRTKTGTYRVFNKSATFDLSDGKIPLLTTKKMHTHSIIHELLWYLMGTGGTEYLKKNNVRIWDEWMAEDGYLGPVYGSQLRNTNANRYERVSIRFVKDNTEVGVAPPSGNIAEDSLSEDVKKRLEDIWEDLVAQHKSGAELGYQILCKRWLVYDLFVKDVRRVPNWHQFLNNPNRVLDCRYYNPSNTLFHPDTVVWSNPNEAKQNRRNSQAYLAKNKNSRIWFQTREQCIDHFQVDNIEDIKYFDVEKVDGEKYVVRKSTSVDQIADLIHQLKHNPVSRRMLVTNWNPTVMQPANGFLKPHQSADIGDQALPACHAFCQFFVHDGKLSAHMYQRSCDIFLGVPFNITIYSLLVHMLAHVVGLEPGNLTWTGGDVHLYKNHRDQAIEQLGREPYAEPRVEFARRVETIDDFVFDDFKIVGYESHPTIKATVSV